MSYGYAVQSTIISNCTSLTRQQPYQRHSYTMTQHYPWESYTYDIRPSPIHGLGVFAKRDIVAGEELPSEQALWLIAKDEFPNCYPFHPKTQQASDNLINTMLRMMNVIGAQLGAKIRRECLTTLLTLHKGFASYEEAQELWERDGSAFVKRLSDIFITNAIGRTKSGPMRKEERAFCAIFPTAARLNHSCAPNVEVFVRLDQDGVVKSRVIVCRDVRKDEELTRSYVNVLQPTSARQRELQYGWNFVCKCTLCARRSDLRAASDFRRTRLMAAHHRLYKSFRVLESKKPVGMTMPDWKKKWHEACEEILSDQNMGVVETAAEKEDELSGLYLFDWYASSTRVQDVVIADYSRFPASRLLAWPLRYRGESHWRRDTSRSRSRSKKCCKSSTRTMRT